MELDSAMNEWNDSLPAHLKWDPNSPSMADFYNQLPLHSEACLIQILVHRPFLTKKSPHSMAALTICTVAARRMARIAEAAVRRQVAAYTLSNFSACVAASAILIMSMVGRQARGLEEASNRDRSDIETMLQLLATGAKRWHIAGRFFGIVKACLASALSQASSPPSDGAAPTTGGAPESRHSTDRPSSLPNHSELDRQSSWSGLRLNPDTSLDFSAYMNPELEPIAADPVGLPSNWDQISSLIFLADFGFPPPSSTGPNQALSMDGFMGEALPELSHETQNMFTSAAGGASGAGAGAASSGSALPQGTPSAFKYDRHLQAARAQPASFI